MYRVIFDTNIWISFLIGKQFDSMKELLVTAAVQPIFSTQLLDELLTTTQKPKLQRYFQKDNVDNLMIFLKEIGEVIDSQSIVSACRDPKDNYLLALAKDSNADFLITGDHDLLVLEMFDRTKIVTYQDFLTTTNKEQWRHFAEYLEETNGGESLWAKNTEPIEKSDKNFLLRDSKKLVLVPQKLTTG